MDKDLQQEREEQRRREEELEKKPSTRLKVIVLCVLVVLLVVGVLLPIKLMPGVLSSLLHKSSGVSFSIDKNPIPSGDTFTLAWSGSHETDGSYIINYSCIDTVKIETVVQDNVHQNIPCSTDYYFNPTENSIPLIAHVDANQKSDVNLTLSFLRNGSASTTLLAKGIITVKSKDSVAATSTPPKTTPPSSKPTPTPSPTPVPTPQPTPTPAPTPTPTPAPTPAPKPTYPASNPNGSSDLKITIVATGIMDNEARFIPTSNIPVGSRGAVSFTVTNIGDKNTGPWGFDARLPSASHPTYSAHNLITVGPNRTIAYVLGFDDFNVNGAGTAVTITVNGDDVTANNVAQISL